MSLLADLDSTMANMMSHQHHHHHHQMATTATVVGGMHMNHTMDMMNMYFVNTIHMSNLVFKGVNTHLWWQYLLVILAVFALSIFNQFLYWIVRRKITYKTQSDYEPLDRTSQVRVYVWYVIKPTVYLFQNALSYILMLVVMSFNMGLFLAIVLGSTIGWTIFSMRRYVIYLVKNRFHIF